MVKNVSCWWRFFAHFSGIGGIIGINWVPKFHSKILKRKKHEGGWGLNHQLKHGKICFFRTWCQLFKKQQFRTKTTLHHPKFNRVPKHYSLENVSLDSNIGDFGCLSSQTKIFHQPGFPFFHLSHRKKPGRILSINYCLEPKQNFGKELVDDQRWYTTGTRVAKAIGDLNHPLKNMSQIRHLPEYGGNNINACNHSNSNGPSLERGLWLSTSRSQRAKEIKFTRVSCRPPLSTFTWRIIPVIKWSVSPILKPFRHVETEQPDP